MDASYAGGIGATVEAVIMVGGISFTVGISVSCNKLSGKVSHFFLLI